jgi:hypothetical protein
LDGDADLFLMNIMRFFEFDYDMLDILGSSKHCMEAYFLCWFKDVNVSTVHDSSAAYLTIFTPNFKHVMQKKSLEALILGL